MQPVEGAVAVGHHLDLRAVGRRVLHVECGLEAILKGQRLTAQRPGEGAEVFQRQGLPHDCVQSARTVIVEPGRRKAHLGSQAISQQSGRLRLAQPIGKDAMRQKPPGEE